jgi:hypothetical protein
MAKSATRDEIDRYSNDVLKNKIRCELPSCHFCNTSSSSLRRHQARNRTFYILCDMLVQVVLCLVIRWKCPACKATFTQQPPFALPCKRYTRETILDRAGSYVEEEEMTYRKVVKEEGSELFHASKTEDASNHQKVFAHTTPYRWITTLAGFKEILRRGQEVILQKDPASTIFRDLAALEISHGKFMTAAREGILKGCRRILNLDALFPSKTGGLKIFPMVATLCAWR